MMLQVGYFYRVPYIYIIILNCAWDKTVEEDDEAMDSSVESASPIAAEKGSVHDNGSDETAYVSDPDAYDSQESTLELPGLDSVEAEIASLKRSSMSEESDPEDWV